MEGYLILAGIIILAALGLAVHFYRRSRQSNKALDTFMATELMIKNAAFDSYKAMLRQPLAGSQQSEITWETKPGRRRF